MKNYLLVFVFAIQFVFAQKQGQARIDSLLAKTSSTKNDTLKAKLYHQICEEYFRIDTDKAFKYSYIGLAHVTQMKWKRGIGVFNATIGGAYSDKGNYDSCLYFYQRALVIYEEIDDKWNLASTLNNIGTAEQNIVSDYSKATDYYFRALKVAETIGENYLVAICYDNIAGVYGFQKNYSKALQYAFKALKLRGVTPTNQDINQQREIGRSLGSIAYIYAQMKDTLKAKLYYQRALQKHQQTGDKERVAVIFTNLALLFGGEQSLIYNLKAKKLWDEVNPMDLQAIDNLGNLGYAYLEKSKKSKTKKQDLQQAEIYFKTAITRAKQKRQVSGESYWTGALAELQATQGDYKNAYFNFRKYQDGQDSLYSQENKNKIANLEGKREIELRDKQITISELAIETQKRQRIWYIVGLGLLAVIGGLLYWQNRTRKRTNTTLLHLNNELDEANQVKAKFFAILSHDLRSPVANLISFLHLEKEAPDLLSAALKERNQQRITESAENLLETMESMLLWSKGQMQNFKPQAHSVEVATLFGYVQKFFAGTTNITFTFDDSELLRVTTDEDYLKTIMQNLTNNAVKALKDRLDAHIHWEAKRENNQIVLAIIDNGPGVSTRQISALSDEESTIGTKTGLGLHLIRDLAKAIACQVSVKSNAALGTEFQLIFAV